MYVIGINGSPTKSGALDDMLAESLRAVQEEGERIGGRSVRVEAIYAADFNVPFHDGSYTNVPHGLHSVFTTMRQADGFIFGTPVHWYGMSTLMKCFLDWMTSLEYSFALEGRVAGVITNCNSDGGMKTCMDLIGPLLHMGLTIPPYSAFYRNRHVGEHNDHEKWQMTDQVLVGKNVARMIAALKHHDGDWKL